MRLAIFWAEKRGRIVESSEPRRSPDSLEASLQLPQGEDKQYDLAVFLGARPDMPDRREYLFFLSASAVVFLGTLAFLGYLFLEPVRQDLYQAILEPKRLRALADYFGYWAQLLVIMFQALDVLIILPLPAEIVSGFLFGLPWGVLYSALGQALGTMLAFLLGRWLMKRYLLRRVNRDTMRSLRRLISREGALTAFLVFLLPGAPKNYFCYLFGLTRISLPFFLVATSLARLPGTILLNFQGAAIYQGNSIVIAILLLVYVGVVFFLYRYREGFYRWMSRRFLEDE